MDTHTSGTSTSNLLVGNQVPIFFVSSGFLLFDVIKIRIRFLFYNPYRLADIVFTVLQTFIGSKEWLSILCFSPSIVGIIVAIVEVPAFCGTQVVVVSKFF